MQFRFFINFLILLLASDFVSSVAYSHDLKLCIPVKSPSLSPFKIISDGKETAPWIVLLRSYISLIPGEDGLLEKYEFSPDGKKFVGKVNKKVRWQSGEKLTACEAAQGIIKGFPYRPIREKIKIEPFKGKTSCAGIKIIGDDTFELTFLTEIENPTGILREALSSGSRENRLWPVKYSKGGFDAITKYPFRYSNGEIVFDIFDRSIRMSNDNCKHPDFSNYPELMDEELADYATNKTPIQQAINLQFNTSEIALNDRKLLGVWLRYVFMDAPKYASIYSVDSFFLNGEPGYNENVIWPSKPDIKALHKRSYKIATSIPVHRKLIESAAKRDQIQVELYDVPIKIPNVDAQVNSARTVKGRHVDLQDWVNLEYFKKFLQNSPLTSAALNAILQKSAATIPPDDITLRRFEESAQKEWSLVPLGRRQAYAFSKKTIPFRMIWNSVGEINFVADSYEAHK